MPEEIPPPSETPTPAAPTPTTIERGKIGINVSVQILLGLVLFAIINYLSIRHFRQWDKTYNREFTLSDDTLTFLKQLDKKLSITIISQKDSPEHKDMVQLADSFHREGRSKLKIDIVDPNKDLDAFQKLAMEGDRSHIRLDLGIFVRATSSANDAADRATGESARATQYIPQANLFRYTSDINQRSVLAGFAGEAALTSALMAVARGDQPIVYLVAHKSKLRTTKDGNANGTIISMVSRQNMKVLPLSLDQEERIPEDANAVFFVGMIDDFDERELSMVRDYWHGKRHALFFMLNGQAGLNTPLVEKFLAENGVVPQQDRVLRTYGTASGTEKLFEVKSTFLDASPITMPQKGTVTTIPGLTRSLKLTPDAEKPRTENIDIRALLSPTAGYWGEMKYLDVSPQADEGDNLPPLYIAASMERGASKDAQISVDSSRMVVIANSSLLDPDYLLPQNYDFSSSCFNWLLQRENYIGINPTPKTMFSVKVSDQQQGRIFMLSTVVLPLTVFLLGIAVWGARRG